MTQRFSRRTMSSTVSEASALLIHGMQVPKQTFRVSSATIIVSLTISWSNTKYEDCSGDK